MMEVHRGKLQLLEGAVQEEHRQQPKLTFKDRCVFGGGASCAYAVEDEGTEPRSAGRDADQDDVDDLEEEQYIDIKEAVDADLLSCGFTETAAAASVSESDSDGAGDDTDIAVEVSGGAEVEAATGSNYPSAARSLHERGSSASFPLAAGTPALGATDASSGVNAFPEVVLRGARDAICCIAVARTCIRERMPANAEQRCQPEQVLLAALGSCDDACRVYVLPARLPQPQHAHAAVDTRPRAYSAGSSPSPSRRRQQIKGQQEEMEAVATLREGRETIGAAAFSFDGKLLACGCFDGVVRVYRLNVSNAFCTGERKRGSVCGLRASGETAVACAEAPDASSAGSGAQCTAGVEPELERAAGRSSEQHVQLPAELVEELRGCAADVVDLSFHPRGYAVIAASADQTAWIWLLPPSLAEGSGLRKDAERGPRATVVAVYVAEAPLTCCCFSSTGREGIVGALNGTISVFSAKTGVLLHTIKHPGLSVSQRSPRQEQLQDACSVVALQLSTACIPQPVRVMAEAAVASGSSHTATAGNPGCGFLNPEPCWPAGVGSVSRNDSSTSKERHDDVLLGLGYEDGWVVLAREATGDVVFAKEGHPQRAVESVAFVRITAGTARMDQSGCCYLFVTGGLDGRLIIWDIAYKRVRAIVGVGAVPAAGVCHVDGGGERPQVPGVTRVLVLREAYLNLCHMHSTPQRYWGNEEQTWLQQREARQLQAQGRQQLQDALVCAGSTDGRLFVLDVRKGLALLEWQAHAGAIMDLTALPLQSAPLPEAQAASAECVFPAPPAEAGQSGIACTQQHSSYRCSCCWRILSAGEDGLGKVWHVSLMSPPPRCCGISGAPAAKECYGSRKARR